jgi:hypothetical protein
MPPSPQEQVSTSVKQYYDIREYPVRWLLSVDISCTQSVVSRYISILRGKKYSIFT